MGRSLPLLALCSAVCLPLSAGCQTPTEVVLRFELMGGAPSTITARCHRSTAFNDNPATPPFVVAALDGADLDLLITPQSDVTVISLLPAKDQPLDLTVEVTAPGFDVMPAGPQDATFNPGARRGLSFSVTPAPGDGGTRDLGVPHDLAGPHDLSSGDGPKDAATPKDGGNGNG